MVATNSRQDQHRVVIVGGGFGGLSAARSPRRAPVQITLVDRRNFHLFQPLLYQVATGALSPANIAAPIRSVFRGDSKIRVLSGVVTAVDAAARQVIVDGRAIAYDVLVLATGATHGYFGREEW